MSEYISISWLNQLYDIINSTLCKIDGKMATLGDGLEAASALLKKIRKQDKAVWWVGNGGSSSICSHLAQDMMNKLRIRTAALTDASLLTAMANDYGYENVYAKPLETLAQKGDLLIAISSSGKSPNILACANLFRKKSMKLITLSGLDADNPLWKQPATISFYVPSGLYGQVENSHGALLHAVIETMWLRKKKDMQHNDEHRRKRKPW